MANLGFIGMAAFIGGITFTIGKYVGKSITEVLETGLIVMFKRMARNGNEIAQEALRNSGINYEGGVNKTTVKNQIGFRVD